MVASKTNLFVHALRSHYKVPSRGSGLARTHSMEFSNGTSGGIMDVLSISTSLGHKCAPSLIPGILQDNEENAAK